MAPLSQMSILAEKNTSGRGPRSFTRPWLRPNHSENDNESEWVDIPGGDAAPHTRRCLRMSGWTSWEGMPRHKPRPN